MITKFNNTLRVIVQETQNFGLLSYELIGPPRRLFSEREIPPPLHESGIDKRRVELVPTPAQLLTSLPEGDNWNAMAVRSQAKLAVAFLLGEDPQRRLDASKAETLMHQASLVQHILSNPKLIRVLIADEVGLGKTIEAGLIIKRVLIERPDARVLYLAPARLVGNVTNEFRDKLDLNARRWISGNNVDARLDNDQLVVASIHRAVTKRNFKEVVESGPWHIIVVDECHHLSDWIEGGGDPNQGYRLISTLLNKSLSADGRLILMSGTPHQGHQARFTNILRLLCKSEKETIEDIGGQVIYRTKDTITDWEGRPLFPKREIHTPLLIELGHDYRNWYEGVARLYEGAAFNSPIARAKGWAKGQALQWVSSSVQAGLGFLVRLAMRRLDWTLSNSALKEAISVLRPYRGGPSDEPIEKLFSRLERQVATQKRKLEEQDDDSEEDALDIDEIWRPEPVLLASLLKQGIELLCSPTASEKWRKAAELINQTDPNEKWVLFAQPVETVTVIAQFLENEFGVSPALIIGNQDDDERREQVENFRRIDGPRFLVSSRAGGEGLNMQCARRLIHLDVPWNPMELEQRIGRLHRFGSLNTVIVDTLVVEGTREVDAYRIARQKLSLIVRNLNAEDFEKLFNRVMALVPPQELESILGSAESGISIDTAVGNEIERLVREGYKMWSSFDEKYRQQENQIRLLEPGAATWNDLRKYLIDHGKAREVSGVVRNIFRFSNDQIEVVEDFLPAIEFESKVYVCNSDGGIISPNADGIIPEKLGLNLPEVTRLLSNSFLSDERVSGAAYLLLDNKIFHEISQSSSFGVLGFIRQNIRIQHGRVTEEGTNLRLFVLDENSDNHSEVLPMQVGSLVRTLITASRQRLPRQSSLPERLQKLEKELWDLLRTPTELEIYEGIRYGVWPVFSAVLVPN